jgi:DNA-binding transcriptional ArsR family regulator
VVAVAIEQIVAERSKNCEVFSNPLRTFIALFVVAKGEVSWSELKNALEKRSGSINPNTLSFHISKLIETGFLKKVNGESQPKYRINEDHVSDIEKMVGKDLIQKMKEELKS